MTTVTLRVAGMTCAGCEESVARAIEQVEGVSEATADHVAGTVSVRMSDGTDLVAVRGAILGAIEDAGFTAGVNA
jgi:copper chaperone